MAQGATTISEPAARRTIRVTPGKVTLFHRAIGPFGFSWERKLLGR